VTKNSDVCRVVIADDEAEFRGWLRSLLDASEAFRLVGEAKNGSEAIQLINKLVPDLVIADVFMPDMDGLEVLQSISKNYPSIKIILTSACDERVYSKLAKEEGALCFIPKEELSLNSLSQICQYSK
jgi:YesN/AraC family two-component response regulator